MDVDSFTICLMISATSFDNSIFENEALSCSSKKEVGIDHIRRKHDKRELQIFPVINWDFVVYIEKTEDLSTYENVAMFFHHIAHISLEIINYNLGILDNASNIVHTCGNFHRALYIK